MTGGRFQLILALILASLCFCTTAQAAGDTGQAWGGNSTGALGNGTITDAHSPAAVSGLSGATAIFAGNFHSLALLSNGSVMAWGANDAGQLGNGSTTGPQTCRSGIPCSTTPKAVSGLAGVVAIASGGDFSLAVLSNGTVMAWGANVDGQLGNGTVTTTGCNCIDSPVAVSGLSGVVAVTAGFGHSVALRSNGTVMAWGHNNSGQLGNGTPTTTGCFCIPSPVAVSGLSGVVAIAAGNGHTLALLSDGTVKAWGQNNSGQLGNGGTANSSTPVAVSGLSGATAIASGSGATHSLALLQGGGVMAWGYNKYGQLGNGTATTTGCDCIPTPAAVIGLAGATAISGGTDDSLALVGPSQALHLSLAGAGTGTVAGPGILCRPSCSYAYPQGALAILRALPAAGTGFAGFTGACTGTGTCQLLMSADRSVVATFGVPKGTQITQAKINKKHHSAAFSFSAPGAITGFQCALVKPKKKHHKKPKPHFSRCSSPKGYKHLKPGKYTFEVRALDIVGADQTPAIKKFKIRH